MKIVSWNCGGAFRKKYKLLDQFGADLLIIQECENPASSEINYSKWSQNHLWIGNKHKGLGVFAKPHVRIEKLNWPDCGVQLFLPCRIDASFNLLATWTKQGLVPALHYIGQLWTYLQMHKDELSMSPSVICGDLNSNAIWDNQHRGNSHSTVVQDLAAINIRSIYHSYYDESHGCETIPTFYLQRKIAKPYHIDYAFASSQLTANSTRFEIGEMNYWLNYSDHMPIIFNIRTPNTVAQRPMV